MCFASGLSGWSLVNIPSGVYISLFYELVALLYRNVQIISVNLEKMAKWLKIFFSCDKIACKRATRRHHLFRAVRYFSAKLWTLPNSDQEISVDVAHVHCANCSRYVGVLEEAEVEAEVVT